MWAFAETVELTDHRTVGLRPLASADSDRLFAFFQALPKKDRLFPLDDIQNSDLIRKWTQNLDFEHVIPLVAEVGNEIVADGTLYIPRSGWGQHTGLIRLVVAGTHRDVGLDVLIVRKLVALAEEHGLEKLQVHVLEDDGTQVHLFHRLEVPKAVVLKNMVKERNGDNRNLGVMICDVGSLHRALGN